MKRAEGRQGGISNHWHVPYAFDYLRGTCNLSQLHVQAHVITRSLVACSIELWKIVATPTYTHMYILN